MNRIVSIFILVCLASACVASDEIPSQPAVQADAPANAWRPEKKPISTPATPVPSVDLPQMDGSSSVDMPAKTAASLTDKSLVLNDKWPSGAEMKAMVEDFMATGFMKNNSPIGFGEMAYTDVFLDFSVNEPGRIDQLDGVISGMYESYSFGIPVVRRGIDGISGSRQVNWEDVIVQLDANRWRIQPVSLRGSTPFEVVLDNGIEFRYGPRIVRITKSDTVFSCLWSRVGVGSEEELRLSWSLGQYERGPVQVLQSVGEGLAEVPVVMVWEPGFISGYLVSLPEGRAEFVHKLQLVPTGDMETDRYNFLVLLTQHRGAVLGIPHSLGAVDPIWLALLMYDYVVIP